MDCMRTNLTFQTTSREPPLSTREFCTARGTTMKNFQMKLWKRLCLNLFFTRRMKMLSRPDGFMLYGKLGVDLFSTSELFYPNMKVRLRLIRARPNFYMISDNPNISLGIVDSSLYTRRIAPKDDYHKKRMDMLVYTPVDFNYLETLVKTLIIPARQNQFIQEKIFNNAPVRRIAIAMKTNSAFIGSYTEKPLWFQQFDLRQIRILRGSQPIVDFDAADNCRLYVTTMKATNFQDDIPQFRSRTSKTTCTSVWFDFDARRYLNLSIPRTSWRTTDARAKLYFSTRTRYRTHCIGGTIVFGCCLQVWSCWKKHLKWIMFLSSQFSTVFHYPSNVIVALFARTMFHLLTMTLFPL